VEDGVTGLLVPVREVDALRAALERLLADGDLRARFGVAAREKARRELSWDRSTNELMEVYKQLCRPSRRHVREG
jgi:glycosyltransferase involved in cell wall biosynthesis